MADIKDAPQVITPAEKGPKQWNYCGPKPAPIISNLPLDLGDLRLGMSPTKYHADELPAAYIPYVMATVPAAKDWWK